MGTDEEPSLATLEKRLLHRVGKAIARFGLISDGDRVLVALSGGKDSFALWHLLCRLQRRAPIELTLVPVHIDPGEGGAESEGIGRWLEEKGFPGAIHRRNILPVAREKIPPGRPLCPLCSRLRRGALYGIAKELGCDRIALGHHADDLIESLLMSAMFNGELASMPPRLTSDDGGNVVIRPLCWIWEHETASLSRLAGLPVVTVCGDCAPPEGEGRRSATKLLLTGLERDRPGIKASLLRSLSNVRTSQLADLRLWGGEK